MNDKAVIFSLTRRLSCDYVTMKGTKRHDYIHHSLKFKFKLLFTESSKSWNFLWLEISFSGCLKPDWHSLVALEHLS